MVFMLDDTVNDQIFGWMKDFVSRFAGQLNVDGGEYRIGAMTFTTSPQVQFHLNRYNFQDEVRVIKREREREREKEREREREI
jgi:hypothetical protein